VLTFKLKNRNGVFYLALIALSISLYLSFTTEFLLPQIVIIVGLTLFYFFRKKILLAAIIIGLLTATSEHFEQYRLFITLPSIILLVFLFIKEFGFNFKDYVKIPKEISFFIMLLFITLTFSTLNSSHFLTSLAASIRMFIFLFIAYLFYSFLTDEKNILVYIYSLIMVLFVIGSLMIIDLLNVGIQLYFQRIFLTSFFNLQGSLAYTGYTVFFITISLLTGMFYLERFNSNKYKIILFLLFLFNLIVLLLANSRGGIVASIISIIFILSVLNRTLLLKSIVSISIIILTLFLASKDFNEAVNTYLRLETVSDREVYWQTGIDIISDYPVFGLGPDTFDKNFFSYSPSSILFYYRPEIAIQGKPHPHNFFLYFTAENGILGFITSITLFIIFFHIAFGSMKRTRQLNKEYFVLSVAITGIGLGIFFRSFIEVTGYMIYGYITRDLPFWLTFIILIFIYQKSKKDFRLHKKHFFDEN
jgi:O-antigen ligase